MKGMKEIEDFKVLEEILKEYRIKSKDASYTTEKLMLAEIVAGIRKLPKTYFFFMVLSNFINPAVLW